MLGMLVGLAFFHLTKVQDTILMNMVEEITQPMQESFFYLRHSCLRVTVESAFAALKTESVFLITNPSILSRHK
jgi:hypothetical protein